MYFVNVMTFVFGLLAFLMGGAVQYFRLPGELFVFCFGTIALVVGLFSLTRMHYFDAYILFLIAFIAFVVALLSLVFGLTSRKRKQRK